MLSLSSVPSFLYTLFFWVLARTSFYIQWTWGWGRLNTLPTVLQLVEDWIIVSKLALDFQTHVLVYVSYMASVRVFHLHPIHQSRNLWDSFHSGLAWFSWGDRLSNDQMTLRTHGVECRLHAHSYLENRSALWLMVALKGHTHRHAQTCTQTHTCAHTLRQARLGCQRIEWRAWWCKAEVNVNNESGRRWWGVSPLCRWDRPLMQTSGQMKSVASITLAAYFSTTCSSAQSCLVKGAWSVKAPTLILWDLQEAEAVWPS